MSALEVVPYIHDPEGIALVRNRIVEFGRGDTAKRDPFRFGQAMSFAVFFEGRHHSDNKLLLELTGCGIWLRVHDLLNRLLGSPVGNIDLYGRRAFFVRWIVRSDRPEDE